MDGLKALSILAHQIYYKKENDFLRLFSPQRVQYIGGQKKYQEYFEVSKEFFSTIHTIEIILRNKINLVFANHPYWLFDLLFLESHLINNQIQKDNIVRMQGYIQKEILKIQGKNSNLTPKEFLCANQSQYDTIHSLLISRLNFGFWIMVLSNEKIFGDYYKRHIGFASLIFPKMFQTISNNQSYFYSFFDYKSSLEIRKRRLNVSQKVILLVSFSTSIRNRLAHCEFLFGGSKNQTKISTKLYNNLYASLKNTQENIIRYLLMILQDLQE